MIVSINQPAYLPWLGYFERIARSDVHIVLDHVQFEKNSITNRNKVRTHQGWSWLTVPVVSKGQFGQLAINELAVSQSQPWQKKHWTTLSNAYAKAPFFKKHADFFESIYLNNWDMLLPLTKEITAYMLDALSIKTKVVYSSDLKPSASKSELVLELCQLVGASQYLSGQFGRDYLDLSQFEEAAIQVQFQDYEHPLYNQVHGEFISHLSTIDLLFNEGPRSLSTLLGEHVRKENE